MKTKYDDDLFKDTTMTFGEHLEELRVSLFKAVLGLVIGCSIGFFVASYVVGVIVDPLEGALETFYSRTALEKYESFAQSRRDAGLPVPYTTDEIKRLVTRDRLLFDIVYVDPQPALEEVLRVTPHWPSTLRPPEREEPKSTDAAVAPPPASKGQEAVTDVGARLAPLFLFHAIADDARVHASSLGATESFGIWLKAALVFGVVLSSPWVFYQIWSFVAAGLYPHEKRYVHMFLPFSLGLFLLGAATAYLFVFQPVLNFLFGFNESLGINPDARISEWLGFVLLLPLGFGISFQLPLVMLFLERIGIFSIRSYLDKWRVAVLVIFILSAVLTPADPYSILFMAFPLTILYFGGILLCRFLPAHTPAER
ncbi:MAG: twin-arginine translocase subunit TatC [Planctomycetia bacterium]|nr:twin-arginine translocase subunit TatC [Planctomycetia bacterium]